MSKKVNNEEMNQEEPNNIPETPETKDDKKEEKVFNWKLAGQKTGKFVKKAFPWVAGAIVGGAVVATGLVFGDKKAEELSDSLAGLLPDGEKDETQTDTF